MSAWIWPITPENYDVLRTNDCRFMDFKRRVYGLQIGDLVAVYVTQSQGIQVVLEARSSVENRRPLTILWHDESRKGECIYPYRALARLMKEGHAEFPPLFDQFTSLTPAQKRAGYSIYLRGKALIRIVTPI